MTPRRRAEWFDTFEGAGLDGVVAKDLSGEYKEGERGWLKVKHLRTADCVVAGFRTHKDGKGVGSLLLGLYNDEGKLQHVGVASSFNAARRKELVDELAPYRTDSLKGHPWAEWGGAEGHEEGDRHARRAEPLEREEGHDLGAAQIGLVAEVAYEHMQRDRFRHTARFQRWRPDREPSSCTYEQLEVPVPMELEQVFGS